jgi:CBS domain-containing protein
VNILELCDRKTAAVGVEVSVAEAIRVMLSCGVGGVAIVDEARHVLGIFTERDVLVKLALSRRDPELTPILDAMTTGVETAKTDITAGEALTLMLERHFRHLPIVDAAGKLLGIVSLRNLLQWRTEDLSRELDSLEQYYSNDSLGG